MNAAAESGMTPSRERMLDVARRAALAAGEAILSVYATAFDVRLTNDNTPVCKADLVSERIIIACLLFCSHFSLAVVYGVCRGGTNRCRCTEAQ